jgi:hypothetical protein
LLMIRTPRYFEACGFAEFAVRNKLKIKAENSIVEKWPMALKLKKGDVDLDHEFEMLSASGNLGDETYVEGTSSD